MAPVVRNCTSGMVAWRRSNRTRIILSTRGDPARVFWRSSSTCTIRTASPGLLSAFESGGKVSSRPSQGGPIPTWHRSDQHGQASLHERAWNQIADILDYDDCAGCHTCEVACQRGHDFEQGKKGIRVTLFECLSHGDAVTYPTDLCNLCRQRHNTGRPPAGVKHCPSSGMQFGRLTDLVKDMEVRPKTVFFSLH